jgi:hypothetical protein
VEYFGILSFRVSYYLAIDEQKAKMEQHGSRSH